MIRKWKSGLSEHKYRISIFALLCGATVASIAIWRIRVSLSGSLQFGFLIWNLFLAWIPFVIAYAIFNLAWRRSWLFVLIPAAACLWLVFFPNAPYVLTDFQHLRNSGSSVPVWYDVLLLIWFSFTSLLLGVVSLFLMQETVRREFGRWSGWAFVTGVTLLSSAGIYMGRFLRWNSWDLLRRPGDIALFALQRAQNPSLQSVVFMSLFSAFFLFLYITLYTFGHLLLEERTGSGLNP